MQLLVSIVRADEVGAAVAGGADLIDVKNPREGSLGASFPHIIRRVRELTPAHLPVSVAIGDVPDLPGMASLAAAGAAACGVQFIKVGLMGPREPEAARVLLEEVCRAARAHEPAPRVIATGYADADAVRALPALELPAVARAAGADGCMLDTAQKERGTLLTALRRSELEAFVSACRDAGLICALAGSLREDDLPVVASLAPDIVGVRGAACPGDRLTGEVDADAVRRLKAAACAA